MKITRTSDDYHTFHLISFLKFDSNQIKKA